MRKVFVVANRHWDIQRADKFGELVYLCSITFPKFGINQMIRSFYPKLKGSNENDYLLLSGLSVMNSIACSIFTHIHGRLNLLIHSKELDDYVLCELNLEEIIKEMK